MPLRSLAIPALAALLLTPATSAAAPAEAKTAPPWQGKLTPCAPPGVSGKAYCGTYEVFENREARSGRKIPLKIVLLPAKGTQPAPDPVFFLEGGPGAGATPDAAGLAGDPARARRDVVLVDTRGTGGSTPLDCPHLWGDGTRLDRIFPPDAVAACRDALARRADLALHHGGGDGRRRRGAPPPRLRRGEPERRLLRHLRGPDLPRPPPGGGTDRRPLLGGEAGRALSAQPCPERAERPGAPRPRLRGRAGLPRRLPPFPGEVTTVSTSWRSSPSR